MRVSIKNWLTDLLREVKLDNNANSKPLMHFQLAMFKRVVVCVSLCILLLIGYFTSTQTITTVISLCIGLVLFIGCYLLAKHKDTKLGTSAFLITATVMTCYFMWRYEGLFDEAVLAFPGFLIFAVLISSVRLAIGLFVFVAINMLCIGLVNEYGLHTHAVGVSNLNSAIVLIIILLMVTLSVYLAAVSIHKLLAELGSENYKVKQSKKEIIRLQNHDPLTGLPNRVLAQSLFADRIKIGAREGFETSLLFVDLDNFKTVNDTYGHAAGDEVLKCVAKRLSRSLRETDAAFRLGGDEFVVLAMHEHNTSKPNHSALAEKLLNVISQPISLENHQVVLTVSIGISIAPRDASNFSQLYQKADLAMYATKEAGRNSYHYFTESMNSDSSRQLTILQALRRALANDEFKLHFQSTQNMKTGEIYSAEALLRWEHPELGSIGPAEFIPIAEQSGNIEAIGNWVLDEAVKACKHWHKMGFSGLRVAVNVSAIQFNRGNFVEKVKRALDKHQLEGKFLVLELTESMLFDMQNKLHDNIAAITNLNVKLALDDFGTGFSNLAYLHKSRIDILKIDRSFVSQIEQSSEDLAIVETIIAMAKNLNMEVIAEGVESDTIANSLCAMNCQLGQGFLWSKALNNEDFIKLLSRNNNE
jgi:diguanylate cyclase (GGDEF)-like protein